MLEALFFTLALMGLMRLWVRLGALERRLQEVEYSWGQAPDAAFEPIEAEAASWPAAAPAEAVDAGAAPEPEREPELSPEPEPPAPEQGRFGFEELFGRRLPIWAGGVTLAVAGVLIVRYSIEAGLLSPLVRFLSGLVFGASLIAAAEAALRSQERVRDIRIRQALAGAGIATLYATILVATNLYALIAPMTAFIGMAAVTGLAMALAPRFGAPSALLGLLGGLGAPALVGSGQPDVPLLACYLALAVGGLSALSRNQRWMWLGAGALVGGLGWGAMLLLGGALDAAASLSIGFYLVLVGIAFPALLAWPGAPGATVRAVGSIAAAAQMAALVATGGFAPLHWGLFGLISLAIVWLARQEPAFARLPAIGLGIALLLLGAWPEPAPTNFAAAMAGAGAIYGLPALLTLWRRGGSLVEAGQIVAIALGGPLLAALHFYRADHSTDAALAAVSLGAALLPAGAALIGWGERARRDDARFALLACAAALLVSIAAVFAAPPASLGPLVAGVGLMLLALSGRAGDARVEASGWLFAAAGIPLLAASAGIGAETSRLLGQPGEIDVAASLLRWIAMSAVAAGFAWRARWRAGRMAAQAAAALLSYGALAQFLPDTAVPVGVGLMLLALAHSSRSLAQERLLPALAALLGILILWAGGPFLHWALAALLSLAGTPLIASAVPGVAESLLRLFIPGLLILASTWVGARSVRDEALAATLVIAAAITGAALHIFFKQLFAIGGQEEFVRYGLAERTLWEALLAAAGVAAWRLGSRRAGLALAGAALAHLGWHSILLHNPLWAEQAVGALPGANLLTLLYGLPLALLWLAGRHEPELSARLARPRAMAQMFLILLLAFSLLRQLLEGSVLDGPNLSAPEDIARSVLAVALGTGFLLWGIARDERDWRIGSLMLMIAAVAKVFLFDASGLDGLLRIASFVALGLSLIGIGWLYSRYLADDRAQAGLR